jgi:hypothetical protein
MKFCVLRLACRRQEGIINRISDFPFAVETWLSAGGIVRVESLIE